MAFVKIAALFRLHTNVAQQDGSKHLDTATQPHKMWSFKTFKTVKDIYLWG